MQRREHEVAGLGGRERGGDRLAIAELAEEDDIGRFAQRGAQARRERRDVRAELALVDEQRCGWNRYSIGSSSVMTCAARL